MPAATGSSQPKSAASEPARRLALLGGPWRIRCGDVASNGCTETELSVYGNPSTRTIESVWGQAKLRPSEEARMLGIDPVLAVFRFPSAVRLLDAEPREESVVLFIESVAALGQPAGLRSVVELPADVIVSPGGVVESAGDLGVVAYDGSVADWRSAVGRPPPDENELLALARLEPPSSWAPAGLSLEVLWQGAFREVRERIKPEQLARSRRVGELRRKLRGLRTVLENDQPHSACRKSLPLWRCDDEDGTSLWFAAVDGQPRLSGWSRRAEWPKVTSLVEAGTTGPVADALDAQTARLPIETRLILRGLWAKHVPVAVVESEGPRRVLVLFGGSVASVRAFDAVSAAAFARPDGRLDARLWDFDRDGREEIVLRLDHSSAAPWLGVFELDPVDATEGVPANQLEIAFWGRDAAAIDEAIAAIARVPRRGIERRQALALLVASKTVRGFRANAAPNAIVFEMSGWYRTGGQVVERKQVKRRDEVTETDVAWLGGLTDPGQNACCKMFECLKETPHCYCSSFSCGVADGFWFERHNGRWVIAGAGWASTQ